MLNVLYYPFSLPPTNEVAGRQCFHRRLSFCPWGAGGGSAFSQCSSRPYPPRTVPPAPKPQKRAERISLEYFLVFVFFVLYSGELKLSNWYLFQTRTLVTQFVHISHQMVLVSHQVGYGRFQTLNLRRLRSVLQTWKEQSNVLSGELAVRDNFNHSLSLKCVN